MPHTGPVRQLPKLGSAKAAAQVAATIIAHRTKLRTRDGAIGLRRESSSYHKFRDAIARAISQEFAAPSTREVLELSFVLETHPLLLRAAASSGVSGIVWPDKLAIWVTRRDDSVMVDFTSPPMLEHKIAYRAALQPPPVEQHMAGPRFADLFARLFRPSDLRRTLPLQ